MQGFNQMFPSNDAFLRSQGILGGIEGSLAGTEKEAYVYRQSPRGYES